MFQLLLCFLCLAVISSHEIYKGIHIRAARQYGQQDLLEIDLYLRRYKYLTDHPKNTPILATEKDRRQALEKFQRFNHLKVTGVYDRQTATLFSKPRCGCPDFDHPKKFVLGTGGMEPNVANRWNNTNLTWRLNSYATNLDQNEVRAETRRAFDIWSRVSGLTFTERTLGDADIIIDFFTRTHTDGDRNAFDGPGNILGHAFLPPNGDAHFDDEESWVINRTGIEYFTVASHEFGHSLGLGHSEVRDALMAPYYPGFSPNLNLHPDDIAGIQALYGPPNGGGTPATPPSPTGPQSTQPITDAPLTQTPPNNRPEICNLPFKAITRDSNGDFLAFVETDRVLRMGSNGGLKSDDAQTSVFRNTRVQPDAAFTFSRRRRATYMILEGTRLNRFNSRRRRIRVITMPRNGTAAFDRNGNDITVFGGDQVWKINPYSGRIIPWSERNIRDAYPGIPNDIDAAVLGNSEQILFFKGTTMYTFDIRANRVTQTDDKGRALMPEICNV